MSYKITPTCSVAAFLLKSSTWLVFGGAKLELEKKIQVFCVIAQVPLKNCLILVDFKLITVLWIAQPDVVDRRELFPPLFIRKSCRAIPQSHSGFCNRSVVLRGECCLSMFMYRVTLVVEYLGLLTQIWEVPPAGGPLL